MKSVLLDQQAITPSKIICIGRNYVEHIKELNNEIPEQMVVFIKPNSAISEKLISTHSDSTGEEPLHYEAELCFMVLNGEFAAVGLGLDLTKRGMQSKLKAKGLPWERAKAFDGAAVISSFVSIDSISDKLNFELLINQNKTQFGDINLMMYKPEQILTELKSFMTLNDGDIVMTGTPKGVGVINKGDRFNLKLCDENNSLVEVSWLAE
jgi:2-keto-4-pentenoate hydratase/2-oxohepta-3-ene-1,7-dioic acid hydratase in catechol pathway